MRFLLSRFDPTKTQNNLFELLHMIPNLNL